MVEPTTPIDPAARYTVEMRRPVRVGLAVYRPDQSHVMTGAVILSICAAVGVGEDAVETVLAAEPIG